MLKKKRHCISQSAAQVNIGSIQLVFVCNSIVYSESDGIKTSRM